MIVFGIHCNSFIVLPIPLKTCRSNGILFFTSKKCERSGVFLRFCALELTRLASALNLSRPVRDAFKNNNEDTTMTSTEIVLICLLLILNVFNT